MEAKEEVSRNARKRRYGAQNKDDLINAIIELHESGFSQVEISKKLGVSRGTILRWNKEKTFFEARKPGEAGKLKCKIHHYDENYFQEVKTPNQAYLVGYILGDGTIVDRKKSKRIVLCLAEKDKQLLADISMELKMDEAIKFRLKNAENEQNKYSLTVNSTKMCNDLIAIGVKPNKTGAEKWICFENDNLQWAFLRGFFDADGHIRVYERNGYLKARMGFTGNEEMLKSILLFLQNQGFAQNVNSILKKQGCSDLYISSIKDLKKIFFLLYQHGDIKLNRQYNKFSSLMI